MKGVAFLFVLLFLILLAGIIRPWDLTVHERFMLVSEMELR